MKTQICTFKALKILVHYLAFNNNIPIYNLNTQRKILRKQGKPSQDNYHSNTFGKREGKGVSKMSLKRVSLDTRILSE